MCILDFTGCCQIILQLYQVQLLRAMSESSCCPIPLPGRGIIRFSVFLLIWSGTFSSFLVCLNIMSLFIWLFHFPPLWLVSLLYVFSVRLLTATALYIFSSLYVLATYLLLIFCISNMFSQWLIFYGVLCCVQVYIFIKSYLLVCSLTVGALCIMFNKSCRTQSTLGP